jgi:hypothetical protein
MDLTLTQAQYDAIRNAKHVPDTVKKVLDAAAAQGGGRVVRLTYEEATALQELCAWNVHTDAAGTVTAASKVFDDVVTAILTHPDY